MSQILAEPKQNIQKIYGFDYLRAIFSLVVVIWHVFQPWTIQPQNFLTFVVMVISYDFLLLAVPVFLQISLFLFYVNRKRLELALGHGGFPVLEQKKFIFKGR